MNDVEPDGGDERATRLAAKMSGFIVTSTEQRCCRLRRVAHLQRWGGNADMGISQISFPQTQLSAEGPPRPNARIPQQRAAAFISALCLSLAASPTRAAVVEAWVRQYGAGGSAEEPNAVVVDDRGNVLVTGYGFGPNDKDYVTVKYSSLGVPLWTNRYDGGSVVSGNEDDVAIALATDQECSVIVTGDSRGDVVTIKYSSAGTPLWTNCYDGPASGTDQPSGIAVDNNGKVFVGGYATGNGTAYDFLTLAYAKDGAPLWTNSYNAPANSIDGATAICVDAAGAVLLTGYSFHVGAGYKYTTIKYSSDGVALWTNFYDFASGTDAAQAMAVDSAGNVFVTGNSYDSNTQDEDIATVGYSSEGIPLWTNRYGDSPFSHDVGRALAVDQDGHVFVTGSVHDGGITEDYVTICYSNNGTALWANRYDGLSGSQDRAQAVAIYDEKNVLVTGYSKEPSGVYNYLTLIYSNEGEALSTNRYDGASHDNDLPLSKYSAATGPSGAFYVAGASDGGYATVKYIVPPLAPQLVLGPIIEDSEFIALYQGTPGSAYTLEYSPTLLPPSWSKLTNALAPASDEGFGAGIIEVRDPASSQARFFRLTYPAY